MKRILTIIAATALFTAAATAQVSADIAEKCFKIMEESREIQAYHGDYSATISLVVEKPGKPKENLQYKIFERTENKLMTIVQLFPEADKGKGFHTTRSSQPSFILLSPLGIINERGAIT